MKESDDGNNAAPLVPLAYANESAEPWLVIVRLVSFGVIAIGALSTLIIGVQLEMALRYGTFFFSGFAVAFFCQGLIGAALVWVGIQCLSFRAAARTTMLMLLVAYCVTTLGLNILTRLRMFSSATPPGWALTYIAQNLLEVGGRLVMPAVAWGVFRRPEVKRLFELKRFG